jgi:hypothetical protein
MSDTTPSNAITADSHVRRLIPLVLIGAAVSVALGTYGRLHNPTFRAVTKFGIFSDTIHMKAWLTTIVVILALVQLTTALAMYGKLRIGAADTPGWVGPTHRWSGRLAFLISIPVAYHCLWSLGFQSTSTRLLVHSLLGCFFYGVFVTKMLVLHSPRLPSWALPWAGGLTFTTLVTLWLTSSLWFFTNIGIGL